MMRSDTPETMFHTGMIKAGAALTGSGLMLAAVGMAVTAVAVARGATAWARQHEVSPTALAAERLDRVRHATLAGAHAWHDYADSVDGHGHHTHAR